ncbi:MAG TPA: tetratricopeptide repeat protein [Verrucomicrobiae bacterium]|nr:tetratricopeptide repeat protein [Verrucomicrobiae bacterium]
MKAKISFGCFVVAAILTAFVFPSVSKGEATTNLDLATPGSSWSLEIGAPGFEIKQRIISTNGTAAQLLAVNPEQGVTVSAFLEKAPAAGDAIKCRDYFWNKALDSGFKPENVTMSETGSVALVEYTAKGASDNQTRQKDIVACLSQNGCWVAVQISKNDFKPADEPVLQSIVGAIRFNDSFAPDVGDLVAWGGFYMLNQKYADAIRCYEKAMEMEKPGPTLDRRQRVFLLDDLIICHGNLGHIQKAKELSELGLQQEPDYPSFYYNLACSYAELGNRDLALENLKKAFQNKDKLLPGDKLDNPKADPSFSKYTSDPGFVEFFGKLKD